MKMLVHRLRGPLLAVLTLIFLACAVWASRPPGEPIRMKDFLLILALFGAPFLVFAYSLWSLSGWIEMAPAERPTLTRRGQVAFAGTLLATASAALLLLLLPSWDFLLEHERLGVTWVISGIALAATSALCGIIGSSKLRRAAVLSALLLPFWISAAGLMLKASMD